MIVFVIALVLVQGLLLSCHSTLLVSGNQDLEVLLEEISVRLERLEAKLAEAEEGYEDSSEEIGEMLEYVQYTPYEP